MIAPTRLVPLLLVSAVLCNAELSGQQAKSAGAEPAELTVAGLKLHGTLEVPAGEGPFAVALIIAGSGPTDRYGISMALKGPNNSL